MFLMDDVLLKMTLKQEGLLASQSRRPAKELRVQSFTRNQQDSEGHSSYQTTDVRVILDRLQSLSSELRRIDKEERDQLPP